MKKFLGIVTLAILLVFGGTAFAETGSYSHDGKYTDGTNKDADDTFRTTITNGSGISCSVDLPGTSCVLVVPCSPFGQPMTHYVFTATTASTKYGTTSAVSNSFPYDAPNCSAKTPNAPVILNITAQ